jgi:thiol:disulfide interchange protein
MASPYLIVAAFPGIAKFIPRPGPWLAGVKRVFGIALLATAGWLLCTRRGAGRRWLSLARVGRHSPS